MRLKIGIRRAREGVVEPAGIKLPRYVRGREAIAERILRRICRVHEKAVGRRAALFATDNGGDAVRIDRFDLPRGDRA